MNIDYIEKLYSNEPDIIKWVKRYLLMFEKYHGKNPNKYPYTHWKSWLFTGKSSQAQGEGLILASLIYNSKGSENDDSF